MGSRAPARSTRPSSIVFSVQCERGLQLRRPYFRFSSCDKSNKKSVSACLSANLAAVSDWYPSPVILMPNGVLLRCISQTQRSGALNLPVGTDVIIVDGVSGHTTH
jgi:hypothetical protein